MEFLTGLLASIIRPIIQKEINDLKEHLASEYRKMLGVKGTSREAAQLKEELAQATSDAEREAILDKISRFHDSVSDGL